MMAATMARGKAAVAIALSDGERDELEAVARRRADHSDGGGGDEHGVG
jgi:hypothetical protein